jgi:uncharacterized protein YuzE
VFPLNAGDADFTVTGYELRRYDNRVVLEGPADDLRPLDEGPTCMRIDLDQDGQVLGNDIAVLLASWGACPAGGCVLGDIDRDGDVDAADLTRLLAAFGSRCGD